MLDFQGFLNGGETHKRCVRLGKNAKKVSDFFVLLPDKLQFVGHSISVRIVNTLGRLKISFFKNNG